MFAVAIVLMLPHMLGIHSRYLTVGQEWPQGIPHSLHDTPTPPDDALSLPIVFCDCPRCVLRQHQLNPAGEDPGLGVI